MHKIKTLNRGKNPTIQQIHDSITKTAGEIRKEIGVSLGVSESIVYQIIRGQRVCSPAERAAIAKIYGKDVNQIRWAETSADVLD